MPFFVVLCGMGQIELDVCSAQFQILWILRRQYEGKHFLLDRESMNASVYVKGLELLLVIHI